MFTFVLLLVISVLLYYHIKNSSSAKNPQARYALIKYKILDAASRGETSTFIWFFNPFDWDVVTHLERNEGFSCDWCPLGLIVHWSGANDENTIAGSLNKTAAKAREDSLEAMKKKYHL